MGQGEGFQRQKQAILNESGFNARIIGWIRVIVCYLYRSNISI